VESAEEFNLVLVDRTPLWLYPGYQQIRLYRTQQWNIDGGFTTLGIANVNFDTTAFHTVKLAMQGSQFSIL